MTSIFGQIYAAELERKEEAVKAEKAERAYEEDQRDGEAASDPAEARLTKTGMRMKAVTSGYKGADRAFLVKNADVFKVSARESTLAKYRKLKKKFNDASKIVRVFVVMLIIYLCFFIIIVTWMFIQMVVEHESWDYFVGYMTMGACMWVFGLGALYIAMKV